MAASNSHDCFRECIGKRVKGVLFNALPWNREDLARGSKTLVFEDGTGLTIGDNGSYWIDSVENVTRAVTISKKRLEATQAELAGVLALAGEAL